MMPHVKHKALAVYGMVYLQQRVFHCPSHTNVHQFPPTLIGVEQQKVLHYHTLQNEENPNVGIQLGHLQFALQHRSGAYQEWHPEEN